MEKQTLKYLFGAGRGCKTALQGLLAVLPRAAGVCFSPDSHRVWGYADRPCYEASNDPRQLCQPAEPIRYKQPLGDWSGAHVFVLLNEMAR